MTTSKVVNVKVKYLRPEYENLKVWMEDENNLYIGRRGVVFVDKVRYPNKDSKWANPFKISKDVSREEVIKKYEDYIKEKIQKEELNLEELREKTLGCWCKPEACHGDVLLKLLN